MKKQWLSIVLVLCMVLCLTPTTALAAEGETGTLKITVDLSGLYDGVDAGGKTFSFEILRKYANYGHYKNADITIKSGETAGTVDVPVEAGKYVVKQISHATIDGYDWENASHQPGTIAESTEQEVFAGKTKSVTVHNFYKIAVTKEITELPIEIDGYALNAKAGDIEASTDQMRVDIHKVTIKQRNASGGWDDLASDATIQANTQYAVEIFVNAKPEYTYTGLTKDKVTVNGKEASVFENPSTQPGVDMRVFHELEVLKVVKKVDHIEITTPPTKTEYMAGEDFDPAGMVVTAVYKDDTTAVLPREKYVIFHGENLQKERTYVRIQYNDGSGNSGIYVDQNITVKQYEGDHQHTYGNSWYSDDTSHWHQCTAEKCPDRYGSTKDLALHTFVWKVDQAATTTQTGLKHEECTVCSYKRSENTVIPATGGGSSSGGGSAATPPASDKAAKELKNAKEGSTVTIDMKGETKLPASVTKEIAGKDVTVELDMGGGMVWSFNGLDVPKGGVSLDLGVKTGTKAIPAKVINALTGEATTIQLQLDHNGPFGMSLKLSVDLGKKHDGLYANLYFYNPKSGELEFQSAGMISGGKASWAFDHASDYAIVIDKESHEPMTFTDVPDTAYYAEAVNWAVGKNITTGMSAAAFDPNGSCTRAQIVTFLWRAAGSPEPKTMKGFDDVASKAYYAKAVAWAVENGITTGTSASKFSPNDPCTRTQAVTFLFRYAAANGMEAVTMQELLSGYADAASVPSYAVSAMNWALAAGILQGDGVKLMPNATCTRAQIVTFLYRAMK